MNWQPIETSPKDGTIFLAAISNRHRSLVAVLSHPPDWATRYAWYRCQYPSGLSVPVASTHDHESLDDCFIASHWMPLPEPPEPKP